MINKEQTQRVQLFLPISTVEKLDEYASRIGLQTRTAAIISAIAVAYKSEVKDYVEVQKKRLTMPKPTIEEQEMAKLNAAEFKEKAKEKKEYDKQAAICVALNGTISLDNIGLPVCTYTTYSMNGPWRIMESVITDPLNMLNDETPTLQYTGLMGETGEKGKAYIEAARVKISANKV